MAQLRSLSSSSHRAIRLVYYTSNGASSGGRSGASPGPAAATRSLHTACGIINNKLLNWKQQQQHEQRLYWLPTTGAGSSTGMGAARCLHQSNAPDKQAQVAVAELAESKSAQQHSEKQSPPKPGEKPPRDPLDVSFNDPIAAFKSKTTWELIRAYMVYTICSSEKLVEHNMKVSEAITYICIIYNANPIGNFCWGSQYIPPIPPFCPSPYAFFIRQLLLQSIAL